MKKVVWGGDKRRQKKFAEDPNTVYRVSFASGWNSRILKNSANLSWSRNVTSPSTSWHWAIQIVNVNRQLLKKSRAWKKQPVYSTSRRRKVSCSDFYKSLKRNKFKKRFISSIICECKLLLMSQFGPDAITVVISQSSNESTKLLCHIAWTFLSSASLLDTIKVLHKDVSQSLTHNQEMLRHKKNRRWSIWNTVSLRVVWHSVVSPSLHNMTYNTM